MDQANQRGDIVLNLPTKAFGIWLGSWLDLESRYRYSRSTSGQFVDLRDDGTVSNPENLVREMDQHISEMANTLGREAPTQRAQWIRGPAVGQSGRSIGAWAICDAGNSESLEYVDKHELAHTTISLLSDTSLDMPMLLAEGWASAQSADRSDALINLMGLRRSGQSLPLAKLTSPGLYGSSLAQNYSHGAPLVWYLLETYGGPKFLELYQTVRRDTFESDVQRVLGKPWSAIEHAFWEWLAIEAKAIHAQDLSGQEPSDRILFDRPDDRQRWIEVMQSALLTRQEPLPTHLAFEAIHQGNKKYRVRVILEPEAAWTALEVQPPGKGNEFTIMNADIIASVTQQPDGRYQNNVEQFSSDVPIATQIGGLKNFWLRRGNLASIMELNSENGLSDVPGLRTVIHRIDPGEKPEDLWQIEFTQQFETLADNDFQVKLWLDPDAQFSVVQSVTTYPNENPTDTQYQYSNLFERYIATRWTTQMSGEVDSSTQIEPLSLDEIADTKRRIETMTEASTLPTRGIRIRQFLFRPMNAAILWTLLAVSILGIDILGDRIKIKIPKRTISG